MRQTTRPHLTPRLRCTQRTHVPHPPLIRHDIRVQPDLLPHSSPCRGRLARESSTASHQSRAPRTECRAVPQHLNPTGLVQVSLGCPFGHNAEQSCATTSTMGSRATGTRRDHIQIRVHVRVRPPCSSLQRRPPRRSCSSHHLAPRLLPRPPACPQAGSQARPQPWCSLRASPLQQRLVRPQARAMPRL